MVTLNSFRYAFKGLKVVLSSERNARIHVFFATLAVLAGLYFQIQSNEWLMIILAITLVFFAEITNTAIEKTLDLLTTESNQVVRLVKDMTAAGVLVTSLGAVLIGAIVFVPRLLPLIVK